MKIIMTLLVRDEQDIIKENIEYHLSQGVDFIIATDNRSVDATPDILRQYERQGVLRYIYEGNDNYDQHIWVTRMARAAYIEHDADWVINNDADEFWWPIGHNNLKEAISSVPPNFNIIVAERSNFVACGEAAQNSPFYRHMYYRDCNSVNLIGRKLPPCVAHRGNPNVIVWQGNHLVQGFDDHKESKGVVEIFHFPIRKYKQFENKIAKGGAAYQQNTSLDKRTGRGWRLLYEQYRENNHLRDYYKTRYYDDDRINKELVIGSIVKDTRLKNYLEKLLA